MSNILYPIWPRDLLLIAKIGDNLNQMFGNASAIPFEIDALDGVERREEAVCLDISVGVTVDGVTLGTFRIDEDGTAFLFTQAEMEAIGE